MKTKKDAIITLPCLIVKGCGGGGWGRVGGGANKLHQGENYRDFLKWGSYF